MPSHVAGKSDNRRGAADLAGLPGVCLILPLHKEEARLFYFYCRLSKRSLTQGFNACVLTHLYNDFLFGFGVVRGSSQDDL